MRLSVTMLGDEHGAYVRHADVERLRESHAELVKALERLERGAGLGAPSDDPARATARAALARAEEVSRGS